MINSIDNDGSLLGYDIDLVKFISEKIINCPLLTLGGAGNWEHIYNLFQQTNISAAALKIFFISEESIISAKKFLKSNKIKIENND